MKVVLLVCMLRWSTEDETVYRLGFIVSKPVRSHGLSFISTDDPMEFCHAPVDLLPN